MIYKFMLISLDNYLILINIINIVITIRYATSIWTLNFYWSYKSKFIYLGI